MQKESQQGGRQGAGGESRGRGGRGYRKGPGGFCVCPKCGEKKAHARRKPCPDQECPKCGTQMIRE